jgi:hypothetical protein
VHQAVVTAGWLHAQANYVGSSDVAVAVLAISQAYGASLQHAFSPPCYGAADYRRHERLTAADLERIPRR